MYGLAGVGMQKINPEKVFAEFRDGVTPTSPIVRRHYTMTHSDETGDLFVTIGKKYAEDKVMDIRDEVRLRWVLNGGVPGLYGEVQIDGEGITGSSRIRNSIFQREMEKALQAIRLADDRLFTKYPNLNHTPVYIQFKSENPKYHQLYRYHEIGYYK